MAKRIIAAWPYSSVADLLKVSGIGPATLKKMEPYLKVEKK
jgi:DNA uptake protein ComE-like DNA-binding protein